MASSIRRDGDDYLATHHHHQQQQQQQQQQCLHDDSDEPASELKDLTLGSAVSCLALRSNSNLFINTTEAQFPLVKHTEGQFPQLQTHRRQHDVEHDHDSGIYELASMLHR